MFNIFKKKSKPTFTELLVNTGYFEFTDGAHLQELKATIQSSYSSYGTFSTTYTGSNLNCKKAYFCDAETVFEGGGYTSQLEDMRAGVEAITDYSGLVSQMPESFDYEANPTGDWFDAVADFTRRVNIYLVASGAAYKCYPAYGGNEGRLYLLNESQYMLLNKAIQDERTRPLALGDWMRKYNPAGTSGDTEFLAANELHVGLQIRHLKFGGGQILEISEKGVATIRFEVGERRIALKYAKLERVE